MVCAAIVTIFFINNLLIDLVGAVLSKDLLTGHGYYRLDLI
jgi:hypothetical protein